MEELKEALAAISGKIAPAPNKVPDGKIVVGITLSRDEGKSGKFMTNIPRGWTATGMAVAIKSGKVIAANRLFGYMAKGRPIVAPSHNVVCEKCGREEPIHTAVWHARDVARSQDPSGLYFSNKSAAQILRDGGSCRNCGGMLCIDRRKESSDLSSFADRVLNSIATGGVITEFLQPAPFTVHGVDEAVDLGRGWEWLQEGLGKNGKSAVPFDTNPNGMVVMFNPGYWLGYVDDPMATGLFYAPRKQERQINLAEYGL